MRAVDVKFWGIFILVLVLFPSKSLCQPQAGKNPYVLFTGLVLTSDSLKPIPYVQIRNHRRGLIGYSDITGHFDVIVRKGDTITFAQAERENSWNIVPDTLSGNRYNVVKLMTQDTIHLPAVFIRAMPNRSIFNHQFVHQDIPDDAYERARKNLEAEEVKEELRNRPADAQASHLLLEQARTSQLYYYKQAPPQNYLSPTAWMQFLDAWKRGEFKKKKKKPQIILSPY